MNSDGFRRNSRNSGRFRRNPSEFPDSGGFRRNLWRNKKYWISHSKNNCIIDSNCIGIFRCRQRPLASLYHFQTSSLPGMDSRKVPKCLETLALVTHTSSPKNNTQRPCSFWTLLIRRRIPVENTKSIFCLLAPLDNSCNTSPHIYCMDWNPSKHPILHKNDVLFILYPSFRHLGNMPKKTACI